MVVHLMSYWVLLIGQGVLYEEQCHAVLIGSLAVVGVLLMLLHTVADRAHVLFATV